MLARTHLISGLTVGILPLTINDNVYFTTQTIIYLLAIGLGSIIADIDEPKSYIGKRFLPISILFNFGFGHRTITHNLLISITGLLSAWFYFKNIYLFGFFIGLTVHILTDAMTGNVKGALWPFSNKFYLLPQSMIFKTNSFPEYIFLFSMTLIFIISLTKGFWYELI